MQYGETVTKTYKSFLATYHPAYGLIRVVIVKEDKGPEYFFCTDPAAGVREILEALADRGAIEQDFHDLKEVWGAGQQQLRDLWANIGAYHLNLWIHSLVELWAWTRNKASLCNRRACPWDDPKRRPSHADRRKALRSTLFEAQLLAAVEQRPIPRKILTFAKRLMHLLHDGQAFSESANEMFAESDSATIRPYFELMPILHGRTVAVEARTARGFYHM